MDDDLLPGPQGKTPRMYEVDKGHKTDSYVTAIRGDTSGAQTGPVFPSKEPLNEFPLKEHNEALPSVAASSPLLAKSKPVSEKPSEQFGYTVAELERYRNDPFWRTLRWFLFILFWLLWILMFFAAIMIVLLSPGCAPKAVPNWWQNAVAYQIWTPSFQDSDGDGLGDFAGLTKSLENLRRLGVQAVWPTPFLLSDGFSDAVRDHLAVDSKLGLNEDANTLIDTIHDKGMKVLISFPICITSNEHDWFYRSARASLPEYANYSSYYHWRENIEQSPFVSEYRNSSILYIHHEGHPQWPVLNWQSADVRQQMFDVFSYWIDRGVDGFYLSGVEYLSRQSDGARPNWSAIMDILRDIRNHVDTHANKSSVAKDKKIILYVSRDNALEEDKKALLASGLNSVINYELGSVARSNKICHHSEATVAGCVHEILSDVVLFYTSNDLPAMWEFGNPYLSRIASRAQSQLQSELLTMVQLLLPGTNNVYYGDEIGMIDLPSNKTTLPYRGAMQWDDTKNAGFSNADSPRVDVHPDYAKNNWAGQYELSRSHLKTFQKLARLRKGDETLGVGQTFIGQLVESGFTVMRYRKDLNATIGNIYVGAVNFGRSPVTLSLVESVVLDVQKLGKVTVVVASSNAEEYYPRQNLDLSSGSITLLPEQGVVFKTTA